MKKPKRGQRGAPAGLVPGDGAVGTNSENQPGFGAQELQRVPAGQ